MKQKRIPCLADLHTHLNEKKIDPAEWWKGAKKKKLSVVAITEHSHCRPREAYLKLKALQPEGIMLIPGIEAKTNLGDLLVYGKDESIYDVKELLEGGVDAEKAIKAAKRNGLVASFAHPFGFKEDSICEVLGEKKAAITVRKLKVGTEYYNGMLGSANELLFGRKWPKKFYSTMVFLESNRITKRLPLKRGAEKVITRLDKLSVTTLNRVRKAIFFSQNASFITAGSDAHYPKSIGSAVLQLKRRPKSEKDFLEMVKKRKIVWAGPNVFSSQPVDHVGRKEIIEGLTYLTKKKIFKRPHLRFRRKKRAKRRQAKE